MCLWLNLTFLTSVERNNLWWLLFKNSVVHSWIFYPSVANEAGESSARPLARFAREYLQTDTCSKIQNCWLENIFFGCCDETRGWPSSSHSLYRSDMQNCNIDLILILWEVLKIARVCAVRRPGDRIGTFLFTLYTC